MLLHVSTLSCHLQGASIHYLAKLHKDFNSIVLYCGRVPAANASGCTADEGLLYKPRSLVIPTCIARCVHQRP